MIILLRVIAFALGALLVFFTLLSAVRTLVTPRAISDRITDITFGLIRAILNIPLRLATTYQSRDQILTYYAPIALLALLPVWLLLVTLGYMAIFWGLGIDSWYEAFLLSGSSLLTLGFARAENLIQLGLVYSEATIGLLLIALLIAYLPTMYAAFQRRESAVTLLEVRAGNPPSAVEMLLRFNRIHGLSRLNETWKTWEEWFVDLQESHTSLAMLVFFRSPQPSHSWITAAGAVLDAAALTLSSLDIPHDFQADLCLRAGYLALRNIADFFKVAYNPNPSAGDPISIAREEFDAALDQLASQDLPVKFNRDQAWRDYAGWRVNYDQVLLALAELTEAPEAPWSSDRVSKAN
ncbi:MAG: hypothetical protein JSV42_15345 [Chloroflexota bacterium]|nr:MAG: hypothetical protein JSV42_15345 [Chloroflexota bacterium]